MLLVRFGDGCQLINFWASSCCRSGAHAWVRHPAPNKQGHLSCQAAQGRTTLLGAIKAWEPRDRPSPTTAVPSGKILAGHLMSPPGQCAYLLSDVEVNKPIGGGGGGGNIVIVLEPFTSIPSITAVLFQGCDIGAETSLASTLEYNLAKLK